MPIIFSCTCGRPITAPDAAKGLRAHCRCCGAEVRVPTTSDPRSAPSDSAIWRALSSQAEAVRAENHGGSSGIRRGSG
jgi:hypothetical protein